MPSYVYQVLSASPPFDADLAGMIEISRDGYAWIAEGERDCGLAAVIDDLCRISPLVRDRRPTITIDGGPPPEPPCIVVGVLGSLRPHKRVGWQRHVYRVVGHGNGFRARWAEAAMDACSAGAVCVTTLTILPIRAEMEDRCWASGNPYVTIITGDDRPPASGPWLHIEVLGVLEGA